MTLVKMAVVCVCVASMLTLCTAGSAAEKPAATAVPSSMDTLIKLQDQRQAEANKSPDGWCSVSPDLRVRFVPQAGVIKAGETVRISVEVENSGTETRGLFIEIQVLAFDGVRTSLLPTTRRTGGSSLDTRGGWDPNGLYVASNKKMVVPWSLPYVLPREGEYRVWGRVLTQNASRIGSNPNLDDAGWLLLPELVLKVGAGDPAAATTKP